MASWYARHDVFGRFILALSFLAYHMISPWRHSLLALEDQVCHTLVLFTYAAAFSALPDAAIVLVGPVCNRRSGAYLGATVMLVALSFVVVSEREPSNHPVLLNRALVILPSQQVRLLPDNPA
jgi:hypothetical protein